MNATEQPDNCAAEREFGSFRDPSGSVVYLDDKVYRSVDQATFDLMRKLENEGLLQSLAADGLIVRTALVNSDGDAGLRLKRAFPDQNRFLEHERIPFVSYPYEWCASMLADAGALHLDLQLRLLKHGYALKDATAFNVAFNGSRPLFIDIPSIEVPRRRDVWVAYGQFCRMFVFPLLLHRFRDIELKALFMSDLNGPSVAATRAMLGLSNALRPAAFVDVFLQNILGRIAEKGGNKSGEATFSEKVSDNSRAQEINLGRLRAQLKKTGARRRSKPGAWSNYERTHRYDDAGMHEKMAFVKDCLTKFRPRTVLDIGCNTGRYSMLAAEAGCSVTAVDSDHDCVDILYRRVAERKLDVLPLCVDIANPAPALGFRHRERKSFEERADFDGVMGLALVHHLLVAGRIPLPAVRDLFAALTRDSLIVEYVATRDPMFQRLLNTRENYYGALTPEHFETVFAEEFEIVVRREILDGCRVLYGMRKR